MPTRAGFIDIIKNKIANRRFVNRVTDPIIGEHLDDAIRCYSQERPRELTHEATVALGAFDIATTGISLWEDGFSKVERIEDPVDDTSQEMNILHSSQWALIRKTGAQFIRLFDDASAARAVRVTYKGLHAFDGSGADPTLSARTVDHGAIAELAGAKVLRRIASDYAETIDPDMDGDSVDHAGMSSDMLAIADALERSYRVHMDQSKPKKQRRGSVSFESLDEPMRDEPLSHLADES